MRKASRSSGVRASRFFLLRIVPVWIASIVTAATFLASIPAEPGAVVLVEGTIIQAVAADVDGDGSREVLVLSGGNAADPARYSQA